MPYSSELKPHARLALSRAQSGLLRTRNGWAARCEGVDPDDLISFRTVKALASRGLIVIDAAGVEARLADFPANR